MNKSIEELTAEVVIAIINANPAWVYFNRGDNANTAPLLKLIEDVHKTFENLKQRDVV